jgi:hypothetical protein
VLILFAKVPVKGMFKPVSYAAATYVMAVQLNDFSPAIY